MEMISQVGCQRTNCEAMDINKENNLNGVEMEVKETSDSVDGAVDGLLSNKRRKIEEKETPKKPKQTAEDKEDMSWICAECKEAECGLVGADGSADFLICDGPCKRIFHIPCAGLTKAPSTDDDWLCQDCSRKEHACAYCSEYGKDFVDVFPCQDHQCGLFFHEACLRLHDVEYKYASSTSRLPRSEGKATENSSDEEDDEPRIPIFTCHAHRCWTCTQKDMIQLEKEEAKEQQKSKTGNKKGKKSRKKGKKNTSIFKCKPGRLYVSRTFRLIRFQCICSSKGDSSTKQ